MRTPQSLATRIVKSSIDWSTANLALADYLAGRFTYRSRTEWTERILAGELTVNGRNADPEQKLALHDIVEYRPGELIEPPAELRYRVVYEDDDALVIDKPGNLCMHPSGPFFKHTLWHLLCSKYGDIHFINRLDRETSGLLLAAKTPETARRLSKNGMMPVKSYLVIVHGCFSETIHAEGFLFPAGGLIRKKRRFSADPPEGTGGERAETMFVPLRSGKNFSLLRADLGTGRMHQIRATLYSLGFPVVGDKLYGLDEQFYLKQRNGELTDDDREKLILPRQALHSHRLSFRRLSDGTEMNFVSELPDELRALTDHMES